MLTPIANQPFESFIRALTEAQTALRGYCHASLGQSEEAKEAVQRTNITLWRKCDQWNPETDFLPWAITVARFEVLGVIRDRQRFNARFIFDPDVVELMADEASKTAPQSSERSEALEDCLGKISLPNRTTLTDYYVNGLSLSEIARACNTSTGALKVMLLRLRAKLRKCVEGKMNQGGAA
jgi:RNA polymerase sigma-70 factor (ECF subfamily)